MLVTFHLFYSSNATLAFSGLRQSVNCTATKMSFFSIFGSNQEPGAKPSGAETVAKLCDRVQSSTLLDDRRDAVRALKALSKTFRLEVGTQSMEILIHVLQNDRSDAEIVGYALDTLHNTISNSVDEDEDELSNGEVKKADESHIGEQFTEIFIKKPENVTLILDLLVEFDFKVRWPAVKLLTALTVHRSTQVQQCVLVSPMGVSKLMDLLSDSREVIRNDGLLLLIQLTKNNANIQKIVAFENAFEKLLEIISEEGGSEGGIVVEDCLLLLLNLLKKNSSNQTFFKEGRYVQKLAPFFDLQNNEPKSLDVGWSAQKVNNVNSMLQVVRTLVSPSNPQQATASCQKVINQCGLLKQLCTILMASGVPADILTETINTVSEVIRGSKVNQEFFASVSAPSTPPRPAIVVLVMSMVNEKQPFVLRCAVLYCFQCFLYKNEVGQEQIISTLLPATADASAITAGQLLCGGLFSQDSVSNWCASVALAHALKDNASQKEQLLRVQLATGPGNPSVSLLQQCTNMLSQPTAKVQTRLGLLMLLCSWLANCQLAVTHFLANSANVPFLMAQVAEHVDEQEALVQGLCAFLLGISVHFNDNSNTTFTKESLRNLISKRIGLESLVEKLESVTKHESYTLAAQKPQLRYSQPEHLLIDYEFTSLYKQLEGSLCKAVCSSDDAESKKTVEDHDNIVMQYKEIIREQDAELNELRSKHKTLEKEHKACELQLNEQSSQIQQLKDQYTLIKAQGGNGEDALRIAAELKELRENQQVLNREIKEKDDIIEKLKNDLTIADAKSVLAEGSSASQNQVVELQSTIQAQKKEIDEFNLIVAAQKDEEQRLKGECLDLTRQITQLSLAVDAAPSGDHSSLVAEKAALTAKQSETQALLAQAEDQNTKLSTDNQRLISTNHNLESQLKTLTENCSSSTSQATRLQGEVDDMRDRLHELESEKEMCKKEAADSKQELDDLLVLLTDTSNKVDEYRKKLKELGEEVTEDEEEEDEDEEEEDEI
ncbi:general vesicular transport factor p115-like [Anneissia japonica]|uniref:general vesicular transport factor p115-like n=1 Tax=Anneissia japonica TaxID=1529436 RepID=UPI001425AB6F|nr:general vesicular transport factor p115-like [Anneissia japonica]